MSCEGIWSSWRDLGGSESVEVYIVRVMPKEGRVNFYEQAEKLHKSEYKEREVHFYGRVNWEYASSIDSEEGNVGA